MAKKKQGKPFYYDFKFWQYIEIEGLQMKIYFLIQPHRSQIRILVLFRGIAKENDSNHL